MTRFLTDPYGLAKVVLKTALTVAIFNIQSIHIAKQGLDLVVRLNEAIDADAPDGVELKISNHKGLSKLL